MKKVNRQAQLATTAQRQIKIDFQYIDLEVCDRCLGSDANLEAALAEVSDVLTAAGADVTLQKTLVTSVEQAQSLGFVSSPTIKINNRDIAFELRESRCEACESCSCNGAVDCRVWIFQGQEYTVAPKAMIVDAILRAAYADAAAPQSSTAKQTPENLRRFFAGKAKAATSAAAECCSTTEQAVCCEPADKSSCCGTANASDCGCR